MKKYTLSLLITALLSLFSAQAAQNIEKCYGQKLTLTTNKTGNSYQWYKDGTAINGATQNEYIITSVDKSAKYECKITTNGTSANTGNLISLGNFEFNNENQYKRYKQHINDPVRGDSYDIEYQLDQLNLSNQANSGEYCTSTNPNNIKPQYFSSITAKEGSKMLVVDGAASSSEFKVFHVRDLKLKSGVTYQFSCWAANIDKEYFTQNHGTNSLPKIKFVIEADGHGEQVLGGGYMTLTDELGVWKEYKATFKPNNDCNWAHITIINTTNTTVAGNDFVLDGIYFGAEQTTSSSFDTETFNLTVYDTFKYKFATAPVCPGEQATINVTLEPIHGGTLEPEDNYKYEWKVNGTTPVVCTDKDLSVTAPNSVGTFSYVLSTSSDVCYTSGAKSETISIDTRKTDCGTTATESQEYTPCSGSTCTLSPKSTFTTGTVTWKDASGTVITDLNINITSLTPIVYTCIIETTAANGTPHTITETHTINPQDCEEEYPDTICNNESKTLTNTATGKEYIWTIPGESTPEVRSTANFTISGEGKIVGETYKYTCVIKNASDIIVAIEKFPISVKNCIVDTQETEELQVKEDGSIKLLVPEENRCNGCSYNWYKKKEDGTKGEAVVKNAGENDWEHTVYNAVEDEYICEIIAPNGNKHVQSYTITIYTPKTSKYCYTADTDEQKETITLTKGDKDEYEWYWMKGNQEIPFPEGSISTENNSITLDVNYFVKDSNSNFPVKVHIVEKFAHKVETTTTEAPEDDTITDVVPDVENPITPDSDPAPAPEPAPAPAVPTRTYGVNINSSALSKDKVSQINDSTFTYNYQTIDETSGKTIDVADVFVVNPKCKYDETFPPKTADMSSHDCNVRLTDKGINGCSAYTKEDPNNKYFIEIDGGDTEGPVFSIKQPGKLIKGKKYILHFLARETTTIAGNPKTTSPAEIDFSITYGDKKDVITGDKPIIIDQQDWNAFVYEYTAKQDCEDVIITLSNYNTESGQNDFAIDEITFSPKPEYNNSIKRDATASNNDEVVDEDGDGYVMWQDEHIITIYPNTTQTITEVSGPNQEYEKEVTLPMGEKITFIYDPRTYSEGMTKYEANDYRTDIYGCTHSVYFTLNFISIEPMIFFSPNNDGVNDLWLVKGIETAPNAYIRIYDKYSKLLYQSKGSDFKGWDGNYNGHSMVQDDYWFVIQIPETEETISGHFILKR